MTNNKKAPRLDTGRASNTAFDSHHSTAPQVTGQCAEVFNHIRNDGPILSFVLTVDYAILEVVVCVYDLCCKGFNILTTIKPAVTFRGRIRYNVALYSLGSSAWLRFGFFVEEVCS